jgi:diguanylate cyclase (GGDEF)-like protein
MRWLGAAARAGLAAIAAVLVAATPASAAVGVAAPPAAQPVLLRDALRSTDVQPLALAWVDAQGHATIDEVAGEPSRFHAPPEAHAMYKLGETGALWLHLRVQREPGQRQEWLLELPMPGLDLATVYQRGAHGGWQAESAGDTLAVSDWPEGGRYPFFRLDTPAGQARDVFVRIRHTTAANFAVRLTKSSVHAQRIQREYLALGTAFGTLLLLVIGCLAQSWVYRDRTFALYALYVAAIALAVASYTGVAAHLLCPGFSALGDAPVQMLAAGAAAAGVLFVRDLFGLRRRFRLQDRLMLVMVWLGVGLIVAAPALPKLVLVGVLGVYLALATGSTLGVAVAAWRRGDVVGKWAALAYLPMTLAVLAGFLRVAGWLPVSLLSQYAVLAAMAAEVPLLLVALTIRSRDRHSAQVREQALTTHDALTGLLAPHLFQDRLRQVIARYKREGQGAAVMFIDLVNHGRIRETFGTAVAEQSLLRSVIKLRRLVRDVDTVARLGEARFAVILEGASSRGSVTDRAARLIAAGLMPLPGLKPDVTLQFHIAGLLLSERPLEAEGVEEALAGQLARMSPRTRRPIRFIVPEALPTSEPGPDSSLFMPGEDARRSRPPLTAV